MLPSTDDTIQRLALDTIQKLFQYFANFHVNIEEIIVNLCIILVCFKSIIPAHFTLMIDAVHINQSWAVNNAAIIFRPKPSKFETRHDFLFRPEI